MQVLVLMPFSVLKRGTGCGPLKATGKVLGTGETKFHGNSRNTPVCICQIPFSHFYTLIELVLFGRNPRYTRKMAAQLSVAETQCGKAISQRNIHTQCLIDLLFHAFGPDLRGVELRLVGLICHCCIPGKTDRKMVEVLI